MAEHNGTENVSPILLVYKGHHTKWKITLLSRKRIGSLTSSLELYSKDTIGIASELVDPVEAGLQGNEVEGKNRQGSA